MPNAAEIPADSLRDLRAVATAGDAMAACELGLRLLIGREAPFEPEEGVRWLRLAAEAGESGALAQLATMKAAGAWMPQDWEQALDLLQLAAERGSKRAQGQLLLLSEDRELADRMARDPATLDSGWRRLRDALELSSWTKPADRHAVCEQPRIRLTPAFASPSICRWLIDCGRGKFKPALMFDGKRPQFSADRTNSDFAFDIVEADLVILLVRTRVSALTRLPIFAMEPPQIFHYATGQEIKAHYDHVRSEGVYEGERIATFLLYLNDDYEGGELEFPKVGFRYRGRAGDGIFFANVDIENRPDALSLHAALPVTRGEKWILSQWIQDRTFGTSISGNAG